MGPGGIVVAIHLPESSLSGPSGNLMCTEMEKRMLLMLLVIGPSRVSKIRWPRCWLCWYVNYMLMLHISVCWH